MPVAMLLKLPSTHRRLRRGGIMIDRVWTGPVPSLQPARQGLVLCSRRPMLRAAILFHADFAGLPLGSAAVDMDHGDHHDCYSKG